MNNLRNIFLNKRNKKMNTKNNDYPDKEYETWGFDFKIALPGIGRNF